MKKNEKWEKCEIVWIFWHFWSMSQAGNFLFPKFFISEIFSWERKNPITNSCLRHWSYHMLDVIKWLLLCQRNIFRITVLVWRCLMGLAPAYLREFCRGRRSLRSMFLPPGLHNVELCLLLAAALWLLHMDKSEVFKSSLKAVLFDRAGVWGTSEQ